MKRDPSDEPTTRDQAPTSFTQILEKLLEMEPRATAAAMVDSEGEAVDYAGKLPTFYTKVAAAHLRVVFDEIAVALPSRNLGRPNQVVVRGRDRSFVVRPLPDGYALVVVLKRRAFGVSARAIAVAEQRLAIEAGWPPAGDGPTWYPVEVETAPRDRRRPLRMKSVPPASSQSSAWEQVEVLGSVVGLYREKGYRCRLTSGAEVTLIREPAGVWYADEQLGPAPLIVEGDASVGQPTDLEHDVGKRARKI